MQNVCVLLFFNDKNHHNKSIKHMAGNCRGNLLANKFVCTAIIFYLTMHQINWNMLVLIFLQRRNLAIARKMCVHACMRACVCVCVCMHACMHVCVRVHAHPRAREVLCSWTNKILKMISLPVRCIFSVVISIIIIAIITFIQIRMLFFKCITLLLVWSYSMYMFVVISVLTIAKITFIPNKMLLFKFIIVLQCLKSC